MLGLRTMWGCDVTYLRLRYHHDLLATHQQEIATAKAQGLLHQQGNVLLLTHQGQLVADEIAKSLWVRPDTIRPD